MCLKFIYFYSYVYYVGILRTNVSPLQLIYEVKDGSGSIQLLTLYPEQLNENMTKKFEALGIEIPNMKYVCI